MSKERPTMRDVAEKAGVTQPTVSYVINNTANISDEVKEKVHRAIKELNYKPNYFARALKTNKSNIIGIMIPDISNEYYSRMIHYTEHILKGRGYTVIIHSTGYDEKVEEKSIRQLITFNSDGIIVMYELGSQKCWKMIRESGKAAVVLEGGSNTGDIPCINTDNYTGAYTAANYLLDQGRTRIAYVGQKVSLEALKDRHQGYLDAMAEAGIACDDLVFNTSGPGDKWKEGLVMGEQLLNSNVDGVIVSSDIIAVGIMKKLLMAGKQIPADIAVIGYDDIPLAELFVPALTTVAQPIESMCNMAVETLMMNTEDAWGMKSQLKPRLILRETV